MIQRGEFIAALGGAAAWPLAVRAQQGDRVRRIGVLINKCERMVAIAGAFNHLLENRPAVVNGRCPRLDELADDFVALTLAPGLELAALVRDRKIVVRLPPCRDAHVERRP
jgi:hypothetical protein